MNIRAEPQFNTSSVLVINVDERQIVLALSREVAVALANQLIDSVDQLDGR